MWWVRDLVQAQALPSGGKVLSEEAVVEQKTG